MDEVFGMNLKIPLQTIANEAGTHINLLRLDTIHPVISGNKWFKLKYHIINAIDCKSTGFISYGGYWSNHLISVAYTAHVMKMPSVGIINGSALPEDNYSQTLKDCIRYGMELVFVGRKEYALKNELTSKARLSAQYPGYYFIPEGAADALGVQGAAHIMELADNKSSYTDICCSVGSGTMMAGLITACNAQQTVHGFTAFRPHDPVEPLIQQLLPEESRRNKFTAITNYSFGGFSKSHPTLVKFMNEFYAATKIPTDRVYSAKLIAGVLDLFNKKFFPPGSRVLVIHCGGLQGNQSFPPGTLLF